MNVLTLRGRLLVVVAVVSACQNAWAQPAPEAPGKPFVSLDAGGLEQRFTPTSETVTITNSPDAGSPGVVFTVQPGKDAYPGVRVKPDGGTPWNLSAFGHINLKVTNLGTKPAQVALRVDNAGDWRDSPFNTESTTVKPGATGVVKVIFGHAYGYKPAFALKSDAVVGLNIFLGKSDVEQKVCIESIEAAGPAGEKPPVDLNAIRTKPENGYILGPGVTLDAKQIDAKVGAKASLVDGRVAMTFVPKSGVTIKPLNGRWTLREFFQVEVKVKNTGTTELTPKLRVDSNAGPTDTITGAPLAPGAEGSIVATFAPAKPWVGIPNSGDRTSWDGVAGTGTKFKSEVGSGVTLLSDSAGTVELISIQAQPAPPADLPEWLGQRPPVEGQWVKTLDDEFEGTSIDATKWNVYGDNYWDKKSYFSKDNAIIGDGVVKLRYEKKRGFHNDNPANKEFDYATGFLDSWGKWTQKYGYFESRMKLTRAPGLWPAFWMMPDRGEVFAKEQWKRADTGNGGMEFDIMEHLAAWGPYRYNIALHWDGYQKQHKQTGSEHIYVQPDKDGFITAGLLWLPGSAVFYAQGKEVARWDDPRVSQIQSYLMFTLPQGGWENDKVVDERLPDDFVIDYVRCWQRQDLVEPK